MNTLSCFIILYNVLDKSEVNLDHSQIVQLECLRSGIWGTKSLWGRVLTYKDL
jgi:phosphosulfolactate synthase (CoM biosynthesis protein A)